TWAGGVVATSLCSSVGAAHVERRCPISQVREHWLVDEVVALTQEQLLDPEFLEETRQAIAEQLGESGKDRGKTAAAVNREIAKLTKEVADGAERLVSIDPALLPD